MDWQVRVHVTCSAMDGLFQETCGWGWEPNVDFGTLGEVLGCLKSLGSMYDEEMFRQYASVVRRQGRAIRRALKGRSSKDLEAVSAELANLRPAWLVRAVAKRRPANLRPAWEG
jgi:hypothetical protein